MGLPSLQAEAYKGAEPYPLDVLDAGTQGMIGYLIQQLGAAGEVARAVVVTFVFTTLIHEPASIATPLGILVLSIGLDYGWKHGHPSRSVPVQVGP